MTNQSEQLKKLLEQPEWTAGEKQWLLNLLEDPDEFDLKEIIQQFFLENIKAGNSIDPAISERLLNSIHQKIGFNQKQKKAKLMRLWTLRIAAACFVGFLTLSVFWWLENDSKHPGDSMQVSGKPYKTDMLPGGNKALLTLADGSTIILDSAQNGALSTQGNIRIIKLDDGRLTYNRSGARSSSKVLYNTISTPNGGQYQLTLVDGSQVWLNAASSIRFPTSFTGKERRVEITGEAYFEIAKNESMPFIVSVNDAEIQVLGTHFNVMAYKDEPALETTLLEGSVKFVKDNNIGMLKPGQQLQLTQKGQFQVVSGIDLTKVVAWKNGLFDFNGSDFETIARKLSRWYNVKVVYNKKIDDLFYAEIPRNTKLSVVLKALELTGKINFEIEGSKIIVLP